MKIAVCDDENIYQRELKQVLEEYYHSLDLLVECYSSGEELLEQMEKVPGETLLWQIVFLDIEMNKIDGMETARRLRKRDEKLPILFLSSHAEYMEEGYEVQAFRFLKKPVEREKLVRALNQLEKRKVNLLELKTDGITHYIPAEDIVSVQAQNVYLEIYARKERYLIRKKLSSLTEELAKIAPAHLFFQPHRSYLINLGLVQSFDGRQIHMQNGQKIPVSRTKREEFKSAMLQFMQGQKEER